MTWVNFQPKTFDKTEGFWLSREDCLSLFGQQLARQIAANFALMEPMIQALIAEFRPEIANGVILALDYDIQCNGVRILYAHNSFSPKEWGHLHNFNSLIPEPRTPEIQGKIKSIAADALSLTDQPDIVTA